MNKCSVFWGIIYKFTSRWHIFGGILPSTSLLPGRPGQKAGSGQNHGSGSRFSGLELDCRFLFGSGFDKSQQLKVFLNRKRIKTGFGSKPY